MNHSILKHLWMIHTVLFDLDGVLVDACEWHYIALNKALKEVSNYEINRSDHKTTFNGLPTKKKLELLTHLNKISYNNFDIIWQLKQKYTIDIISEHATINDKKIELHKHLQNMNIKIGCVTNSIKETATLMLKHTGQLPFIDLLITNDMIINPKPNSECYLTAMKYFQSLPQNTLIVEDSIPGLLAAQAAQATIWQVNNSTEVILENILEHLKCK